MRRYSHGFTLVEMVVVAPIVILAIGAFIALIVNLTGEVLSSRGSNTLTYNIQDALNRIEADVKLSATTLAANSIPVTSSNQGYVANGQTTPGGSTVNFTNIDKTSSGGSPASLILNSFATNGNPLSDTTTLLYLKDTPNDCSDFNLYSKNTPLTTNIVYYIANNTLWRRTIMPSNYATAASLCGGTSWQRPSCLPGYTVPFCQTNDEKLIEGVAPSDFSVNYYSSSTATTPIAAATSPSATDAARNTALQGASTIKISITAKQTIAGRDITRTGAVQVTRLDTNASAIAPDSTPTSAPTVMPVVSSTVYEGHKVRFTWNQVPTATSYDVTYTVNGANPQTSSVQNDTRKLEVTTANHTDVVAVTVKPRNIVGASASGGTNSTTIPLWAPLLLKGSWTDYGGAYSTAAYTKTKAGVVMLKGLVKNPSSPGSGSVIATLPSDYIPNGGSLLFGTSTYPNANARVDVLSTGDVVMTTGVGGWVSLESIRFNPTATGRVTPTLLNGFSNYGGSWAPASYAQDSTGRVSVQGVLQNGTRSDNTQIFGFSSTPSLRPSLYGHFASQSGGGFHHVGVGQATQGDGVLAKGNGTGIYSINLQYYPAGTGGTWQNLTLLASWSNYDGGATFATAQCTKTADGVVTLRGLIKGGSTTAEGVIATIPSACGKPKQRMLTTTVNTAAYSRIDIFPNPDGTASVLFEGSSATWYALDDISYIAE